MHFLCLTSISWGLYTHCLEERKEVASADVQVERYTEKEYGMVRLENVRNVLFQTLLLDDVMIENGKIYARCCTVYLLST